MQIGHYIATGLRFADIHTDFQRSATPSLMLGLCQAKCIIINGLRKSKLPL